MAMRANERTSVRLVNTETQVSAQGSEFCFVCNTVLLYSPDKPGIHNSFASAFKSSGILGAYF